VWDVRFVFVFAYAKFVLFLFSLIPHSFHPSILNPSTHISILIPHSSPYLFDSAPAVDVKYSGVGGQYFGAGVLARPSSAARDVELGMGCCGICVQRIMFADCSFGVCLCVRLCVR